jgi:hypothetical protein
LHRKPKTVSLAIKLNTGPIFREVSVRDFQLIVADKRQSVPGLRIALAQDEVRARAIAERVLAESRHYRAVEVLEYGRPLFSILRQPRA